MYGTFISVDDMNKIIFDKSLMHVRGEMKGEIFHWTRVYAALKAVKINKVYLVIRDEDEGICYMYFKDNNITQYFTITNFKVDMFDFMKINIMTDTLFDELAVKAKVDLLENNA
jgi:hypothetical protein